ncbi:hypothetical protein GYMLUDRAFT_920322 [Collybiopsis luxurians FD-317 M1]|uniref:Uncharacterized protein n=1 Tax=Collybiopsis luxurians FD-317 M1 TaxID=944289 RepID=A0A0D0BH67_9AGAR|nr:hypothetical protein GYMLUDRAFT_920322 [Collybiopsis luxurians FD-317 M1]
MQAMNRLSINDHGPRRVSSTPVLRTQSTSTSITRSRQASFTIGVPKSYSGSHDDDQYSTNQSVMQRPPEITKRVSAWARPFVEDIYEHLHQYFPGHDIDQPIVDEVETAASTWRKPNGGDSGPRPKKTIRMVVEQQVRRLRSTAIRKPIRATKLWGSHLKEVGVSDFNEQPVRASEQVRTSPSKSEQDRASTGTSEDVDKALRNLEQRMFDRSDTAGPSGNYQWGLDKGHRENKWDPLDQFSPESAIEHQRREASPPVRGPEFISE